MTEFPKIPGEENLARFILYSKHIRHSDGTVRPDAFVPHPYSDLSVTRHLDWNESRLWTVGRQIAKVREKRLHGRCDVQAITFQRQHRLIVEADPIPENPNHAAVRGWPKEKSLQKRMAQEIAVATGQLRPTPVG